MRLLEVRCLRGDESGKTTDTVTCQTVRVETVSTFVYVSIESRSEYKQLTCNIGSLPELESSRILLSP